MSGTTTIVIFGASGDLTRRKLIPALLNLYCKGRLPEPWRIVGVSRTQYSDDEYRTQLEESMKELAPDKYSAEDWATFALKVSYYPGDLGDVDDYKALDAQLSEFEKANGGQANRIYYLSVAPRLYEMTIHNLGNSFLFPKTFYTGMNFRQAGISAWYLVQVTLVKIAENAMVAE